MKTKIQEIITKIKSDDFWKNLFKNSFIAVIGEGGASFINFFSVILLIKLIGNNGYAILILAQTYMTIIDTILNLQCWRSVIKFGEEAKAKKNETEFLGYVKLGTIIDIVTAILGTIVCFLMVDIVGYFLNWNDLTFVAAKIFSLVIISHFSGTPIAILRMENKFNLVSIQKIIASLLKFLMLLFVLIFKREISVINGVIIYAVTDFIANLILVGMALWVTHINYGIKKVIKANIPKKAKGFLKFTLWTSCSDITDIPVNYFDIFLISQLKLELVAVFKVFKQIIALVSKMAIPIYQVIFPQFSKLIACNKLDQAYNAVKKIQKFVITYILPFAILFGLTSYFWLEILFDSLYSQQWYVLAIYIIVHTISISFTTIHPLFISMGKVKEDFLYVLITNILYFIFAIILVKWLGMLGIVAAYAIQSFSIIWLKKRKIEKSLKEM